MSSSFFAGMAGFTMPNTIRNQGPLPGIGVKSENAEFQTPDGMINETNALLDNVDAYAYGPNAGRPSTQTSYINHPHRIQKVIPKIFLPAASGDVNTRDVALEHALHDGDLTFTLRMPKEMVVGPSEFCHARNIPGRALAQLVNLATVNYILWGLQVGRNGTREGHANRWDDFFLRISQGKLHALKDVSTQRAVWLFLQTFLRPFGVMTGSDMQGGQHEGGNNNVATYPVDYVASFLVDGKCRKLNNLWRHCSVAAGDNLVLVLRQTTQRESSLVHILTSGSRSFREERTRSDKPWWYLCPEIEKFETQAHPYMHIGRSQGMYSAYNTSMGMGRVPWDARASLLGQGVQVTFQPACHTPPEMEYGCAVQPPRAPGAEAAAAAPPTESGTGANVPSVEVSPRPPTGSPPPGHRKKKRKTVGSTVASTASSQPPAGVPSSLLDGAETGMEMDRIIQAATVDETRT